MRYLRGEHVRKFFQAPIANGSSIVIPMYSAAGRCRNFGSPRQRLTAASSQRVVNDPGRCLCAGGSTIVTALIVPKSGGVTSTKVNVVRWLKREGEPVKSGEAIVELETEKVSYELESPAAGVLLKIIAGETTEVPVGDPLGYIGQPGEAIPTS